jgi:hypothetical protein
MIDAVTMKNILYIFHPSFVMTDLREMDVKRYVDGSWLGKRARWWTV